jgi:heat shock protein HtpX
MPVVTEAFLRRYSDVLDNSGRRLLENSNHISKSIYDRIRWNALRSQSLIAVLLIAAVLAVTELIVSRRALTLRVLMVVYLAAFLAAAIIIWLGEDKLLKDIKAQTATHDDHPYYMNCVEALSIAAGMASPIPYVVDDKVPNAFAVGMIPGRFKICVTTGLLNTLDRTELEGVVAHELSHIRSCDTALRHIVTSVAALLYWCTIQPAQNERIAVLARFFEQTWFWILLAAFSLLAIGMSCYLSLMDGLIALIACIVVPMAVFMLIMFRLILIYILPAAFFREREFLADAEAALLTRYPAGLIHALEKITDRHQSLKNGGSSLSRIMFVPSGGMPVQDDVDAKVLRRWFAPALLEAHPSVKERIKRLMEIQASSET